MKLNIIVDDNQVGDAAPLDNNHHLIKDEVCKVGKTFIGSLSTYTNFDEMKINFSKKKFIKLINNNEYNINGKIISGILVKDIYLIIDCGILIRVWIKDPRDWDQPIDMRFPYKNDLKTVIFRKNDFINFNSIIYADASYDEWESTVWCNSNCKIIERTDKKGNGLLLIVECIYPQNPIIKIDEYYGSTTKNKIWGEIDHFSVDF